MTFQHRHGARVFVVAAVLVLGISGTAPAFANHKPSFPDGNTHAFGEMVAYPLAFPIGDGHRFRPSSDSFWALRYGTYTGPHHAADLMAPKMTAVFAAASGTIERVNWSRSPDHLNPGSCCSIVLDHDDGWESWYLHLNNDTPGTDDRQGWGIADGIRPGVRVSAGQLIGWVGDSGNAENTAAHLHFELRDPEGIWVNPHESLVAAMRGETIVPVERPIFSSDDVIRPGDRGAVVADLQAILGELGYDAGPTDGIFGTRSSSALAEFQDDAGLFVDGKLGPNTRSALRVAASSAPGGGGSDPTLRPGDRGEAVRELQEALNAAGFEAGTPDGVYGPMTVTAVEHFQRRDQGLVVDGKAGANTLSRLDEVVAAGVDPGDLPTIRPGDRGDDVRRAQTLLEEAGFDPGPIDGIYGSGTTRTVAAFQRSAGLFADGIVGRQTWAALLEG